MAEILVLVVAAGLLFAGLAPVRRWIERRYIRSRGGTRPGVVVAMKRREDGSYAASQTATPSGSRAGREEDDADER